jgi:DMSO/TMAO reductase YedYZ molybdopterin-dependent catalytic subunit
MNKGMGIKNPLAHVQRLRRADKPGEEGAGQGRVPPGQYLTDRLPVLHYGGVPRFDKDRWDFRIWGLVEKEKRWTFDEFRALPTTQIVADIHCVTRWSKLDTQWEGVTTSEVLSHVQLKPEARFVLIHAEQGFTTNLPLEDLTREENLFAWRYGGEELTPAHGWPLRLIVPSLYFWKSAKWVRGLELLAEDRLGFWESYGYHRRGDPWKEERFG